MDGDRLILGTAQLGADYGVANTGGLPDAATAAAVLDAAWEGGVRTFDTAQAYGTSETAIGSWCNARRRSPRIVTKLAPTVDAVGEDGVVRAVRASLERLAATSVDLLLHDPEQLRRWDDGVASSFGACRDLGLVDAVGVSVYELDDATRAVQLGLDVIQLPYNVLDRRFRDAGLLALEEAEIHVRSVMLQGLLALEPTSWPQWLDEPAERWLRWWHDLCSAIGEPPASVALRFVVDTAPGVRIVFGAELPEQVRVNVQTASSTPLPDGVVDEILARPVPNSLVIDPRRWPAP